MTISVRMMMKGDPESIHAAFVAQGWNKPISLFARYLDEHTRGTRVVIVAVDDTGAIAGYGTVVWESHYPPFARAGIPEIVDLNVLAPFRRNHAATMIMDTAEGLIEQRAAEKGTAPIAGIGVGLYADYGAAQQMYLLRGYLLDGRGAMYNGVPVPPGESRPVDDALNLFLTRRLE